MQFFIRFRLLDNFRGFVDFGVSYVLVRQNVRLRIVNIMTDGGRWKLIFFPVNLYKNTSPTANINLSIICSYSSYIGTIKNKRHISFACSIFPWYWSVVFDYNPPPSLSLSFFKTLTSVIFKLLKARQVALLLSLP